MLITRTNFQCQQHGIAMLEALITVIILAFGLLGLATLQSKMQLAEEESYQRAQAIVLLTEMMERLGANRTNASSYVTSTAIGTGDSQPASCTGLAVGASRDICEWSNGLKGAAETSGTTKTGAMINAHGCVTTVQAQDATMGVCQPGIYRVTVTWSGINPTAAPSLICPGDTASTTLRSLSSEVTVSLPSCAPATQSEGEGEGGG